MNAADLRKMSEADIQTQVSEAKAALSKMKFGHTIAGTENPMVLRAKRREIACMLTVLNEKKNNSK
jgi:large subunit ribosomal protein L29